MESNTPRTDERYDNNEKIEGRPTLVSVYEDDVTVKSSEIDDDSTGMHKDDFWARAKKRKSKRQFLIERLTVGTVLCLLTNKQ